MQVLILVSLICLVPYAHGAISFASYYANSMVLQSEPYRAVVWGYGDGTDAGQQLTLAVAGKQYNTIIQPGPIPGQTTWSVTLDAQIAGGPYVVQATSQAYVIQLIDVMFGEVWICSGQSNMEHSVANIDDAQTEIVNAVYFQNVRLFRAGHVMSYQPLEDLRSVLLQWTRPDGNIVAGFSAVCWLFGRRLFAQLNKPIGLVQSAWGGTRIEAWSSSEANAQCPDRRVKRQTDPNEASVLWNAMIHPLLPMTIKGVIWYQGESNAGLFIKYNCSFPVMIADWRLMFNAKSGGQTDPNFPFGFVQLAPFRNVPDVAVFPFLRWAQTASKGYVPNNVLQNVFMAVAMDLPDFDSPVGPVHPRFKQDIGRRLAISGLTIAYGQNMGRWHGPRPTRFAARPDGLIEIEYEEGNVQLLFKNGNGFELCCSPVGIAECNESAGSVWVITAAVLEGTSIVVLDSSVCVVPTSVRGVRYAWRESPCPLRECSLYSTPQENEMPTPPFYYEGTF